MINKEYRMRLRRYSIVTMKYFFAVLFSLGLAFLLDIPDYLSASFIAVLTLQPNLYRGIEFSWQQIKGTVLGAIVTVAVVGSSGAILLEFYWPMQSAVAMAITIGLCLYFDLDEGTVIAVFTVAYLTSLPKMIDESFFITLDLRFITIGIGLSVGLLLNYTTSLFGYWDRLYLNVSQSARALSSRLSDLKVTVRDSEALNRDTVRKHLGEFQTFRRELNRVEIDLEQIEYRAPSGDDGTTVKQEARYRREFETVYFLKDLSHHVWSLLLYFLKEDPSTEVHERMVEELPEVADIYETLYRGLLNDDAFDADLNELTRRIKERESKLSVDTENTPNSDVPVLGYFLNCYDILLEGTKILENTHSTG